MNIIINRIEDVGVNRSYSRARPRYFTRRYTRMHLRVNDSRLDSRWYSGTHKQRVCILSTIVALNNTNNIAVEYRQTHTQ